MLKTEGHTNHYVGNVDNGGTDEIMINQEFQMEETVAGIEQSRVNFRSPSSCEFPVVVECKPQNENCRLSGEIVRTAVVISRG